MFKRKMKEVGGEQIPAPEQEANRFDLFNLQFASTNDPPVANSRHSQVQQILNSAAPLRPFSFMSMLAADDEDDRDSFLAEIKSQREQMNHILLLHTDILRQALGGMLEKQHKIVHRAAEEKAAKKLKQKEIELQNKSLQNIELERKAEHYKKEAERLSTKVRNLERATMSLKSCLEEAKAARRYAETAQEEAESSFEDPDRVAPVRLDCKVCDRQLASVMMWPCRHVCVCTRCDAATKVCPVCRLMKTTSVEVYLSLD
ncbi:hypothetical protein OROHE_014717 [Orobanche hederae]